MQEIVSIEALKIERLVVMVSAFPSIRLATHHDFLIV